MQLRTLATAALAGLAGLAFAALTVNVAPPSGTTQTSTWANASVVTGSSLATSVVYYGTTDGTTNPASWASTGTVIEADTGTISNQLTNLSPGTLYFYRWRAISGVATSWASASALVRTLYTPTTPPPAAAQAVMVSTNGVLISPPNFFTTNPLSVSAGLAASFTEGTSNDLRIVGGTNIVAVFKTNYTATSTGAVDQVARDLATTASNLAYSASTAAAAAQVTASAAVPTTSATYTATVALAASAIRGVSAGTGMTATTNDGVVTVNASGAGTTNAGAVNVAATAASYTSATVFVEGHRAGIDTRLGEIAGGLAGEVTLRIDADTALSNMVGAASNALVAAGGKDRVLTNATGVNAISFTNATSATLPTTQKGGVLNGTNGVVWTRNGTNYWILFSP